jgi:hypothetical protein
MATAIRPFVCVTFGSKSRPGLEKGVGDGGSKAHSRILHRILAQ